MLDGPKPTFMTLTSLWLGCVGRQNVPKAILIPGICEYVITQQKGFCNIRGYGFKLGRLSWIFLIK
jgi:hypothetical protein